MFLSCSAVNEPIVDAQHNRLVHTKKAVYWGCVVASACGDSSNGGLQSVHEVIQQTNPHICNQGKTINTHNIQFVFLCRFRNKQNVEFRVRKKNFSFFSLHNEARFPSSTPLPCRSAIILDISLGKNSNRGTCFFFFLIHEPTTPKRQRKFFEEHCFKIWNLCVWQWRNNGDLTTPSPPPHLPLPFRPSSRQYLPQGKRSWANLSNTAGTRVTLSVLLPFDL